MDSDTKALLTYAVFVVIVSVVGNICARRYWLTCTLVTVGCGGLTVLYQIVAHDFHIRPKDIAFWLPALFLFAAAVAFPIAFIVGLPFHFYRRVRKK
jgi:hypothetical protein